MVAWNSVGTEDVAELAVRMATDRNAVKENPIVTAMNKGASQQQSMDTARLLTQLPPQPSRGPGGGIGGI